MTFTDELLARWAAPLPAVRDLEDERRHDLAVEVLRLRSALVEAAAREREECARVAEGHNCDPTGAGSHGVSCQRIIASDIRARGLP